MAYLTQSDLVSLFGEAELIELTNLDDPTATQINADQLAAAIAYAEAEVNGYVAARYTLPLAVVPLVLKNKTADIARYFLDRYRAREDVRQRYEDAVRWLEWLAKGIVALDLPPDQPPASAGLAQYSAPKRVYDDRFTRDFGLQ